MTNTEKLTLAISNFIKNEIEEEIPSMLTCAFDDVVERINVDKIAIDYIKERIEEEIGDFHEISASILEERIDRQFLDFEDMAREQIKDLDFDKMAEEVIEEEIQNIDLFDAIMQKNLDLEKSIKAFVKQATREEFKNLLKPVYKNLKSLYFDITNR